MAKKAPGSSSGGAEGTGPAGRALHQHRIALLHGKDAFLRWLKTEEIRAALTAAHGAFDAFQFDGASARASDVLDECRTFGLMSGHKLVIVDNAEELVKDVNRPLMERYAEKPADGATLLLRAETWRAGKLDAMIQACGVIIDCEPMNDAEAARWAADRATRTHRVKLGAEAAAELVRRLGSDLGRIDGEVAKLAIGATLADTGGGRGGGGEITVQQIVESVGMTREEEAWDLQRVLLVGGPEQILSQLRQIVEVSREPTTLVTYACIDLARKLHGVSAGQIAGANPFQLAGMLKLFGSGKDAILSAGREATPTAWARLLAAAIHADVRQKTGLGDPLRTLECLSLRFAAFRSRGAPGGPARR